MREESVAANRDMLESLHQLYKGRNIIKKIKITKQKWYNYRAGVTDVPRSVLRAISLEYDIPEEQLILETAKTHV